MSTTIKNPNTPARLRTLKIDMAGVITDNFQEIIRGELDAGNLTRDESTKLQLWFVQAMDHVLEKVTD